jgi:hypothetical protein
MAAIVAAAGQPAAASATDSPGDRRPAKRGGRGLRKIATEEAFTTPEVAQAVREVVRRGGPNLDLKPLALVFDAPDPRSESPVVSRATSRDAAARSLLPRLLDLDALQRFLVNSHTVAHRNAERIFQIAG